MGKVTPVERTLIIEKDVENVRFAFIKQLAFMKGKIVKSDKDYIECDLGSLAKSRVIGEFFVSKTTLPKKVIIRLESVDNSSTKAEILVIDTHKYGVKWGYVKKYEEALQELAASIIGAVK